MQENEKTNIANIAEESETCCNCKRYKSTPRSETTQKALKSRINRIIGQLGGISKMLDDGRYCGDILTQIGAAESALQSIGYLILQEHIHTCVVEEVTKGNTAVLDEALDLFKKIK